MEGQISTFDELCQAVKREVLIADVNPWIGELISWNVSLSFRSFPKILN